MSFSNYTFYFETSSINYLTDRYIWKDAIETKKLQVKKGNIWYISPVTLWEILLTTDKNRREEIIFYCQNLFYENLLPSPAELTIRYIEDGCPIIQEKFELHSKLEIANTWTELCKDISRTFTYDFDYLKERMKIFQELSKQIDKIINHIIHDSTLSEHEKSVKKLINIYFSTLEIQDNKDDLDYHKVIKISILFILYNLCIEVDIDNSPQKEFWKSREKENTLDRLNYIFDNYKDLIFRGPFYQMAIMAFHQISIDQKKNRGLYMDCLHSIYLTYCNIFITNDEHFKTLREKKLHPNFSNILHVTEIGFVEKKINIP